MKENFICVCDTVIVLIFSGKVTTQLKVVDNFFQQMCAQFFWQNMSLSAGKPTSGTLNNIRIRCKSKYMPLGLHILIMKIN